MESTYSDGWSDMAQPCDMGLWVMKWRSAWPIFHGPVILSYILKTIWCMYIILWEYESVWPNVWPQNKCKSLWLIFHGPVILPCILLFDVWTILLGIMCQYDPKFDLKINIGHYDLYFMVQWFCHLEDFGSMNRYDQTLMVTDLHFMVQWICLIDCLMHEHYYLGLWVSMTQIFTSKCRSLWPIFYGPVILRYILKTVWCMNIILWD